MFGKSNKSKDNDQVIMRIVKGGEVRDVTVREMVLSQNLSMEALTSVLIKKGILNPQELLDEIEIIRQAHTRKSEDIDDAADETGDPQK